MAQPIVGRASISSVQPKAHHEEVRAGARFEFGANWSAFLTRLSPRRIELAEQSLRTMLHVDHLQGKSFLDIGSGSGLFSLAARRLGAKVHSFDFDPQSVRCTQELKRRYFRDDADWRIEEGSVLDRKYLDSLGQFDIVYSWGVLHHTGEMWTAIGNAASRVAPGGRLFIAIYGDSGRYTRRWRRLKRLYNAMPRALRPLYTAAVFVPRELYSFLVDAVTGRLGRWWKRRWHWTELSERGMSYWHDFVDWLGGWPFEVARPDEVFQFCRDRGFRLIEMKTVEACNEFVFEKEP